MENIIDYYQRHSLVRKKKKQRERNSQNDTHTPSRDESYIPKLSISVSGIQTEPFSSVSSDRVQIGGASNEPLPYRVRFAYWPVSALSYRN